MRLVRYGEGRVGVVADDGVADLTDLTGPHEPSWPPVQTQRLIHDYAALQGEIARRRERGPTVPWPEVTLRAPIVWPSKLVGMPANYQQHIEEMRSANRASVNGFFLKAPSSISGPADPVVLPRVAGAQIDHESELGLVIGRRATHVPAHRALDYVFGYTCLIDVTVRSPQERVTRKSFDTFAPLGPWIVTADEVGDPGDLDVELTVNGATRQRATTRDLIVSVPEIVAMVSSVCTLEPGDVIATGSPQGVGPLVEGDRVAIDITGIGSMALDVVRAEHDAYPLGWNEPRPVTPPAPSTGSET